MIRQGNEIADTVKRSLEKYFRDLDGEKPRSVYDMVIRHVERPLLEVVLDRAEGNQTIAAQMLGINRNTLRKKMQTLKIKL
jgi:Fis family transcriptional regulator, factor for inversion stimulation protein